MKEFMLAVDTKGYDIYYIEAMTQEQAIEMLKKDPYKYFYKTGDSTPVFDDVEVLDVRVL